MIPLIGAETRITPASGIEVAAQEAADMGLGTIEVPVFWQKDGGRKIAERFTKSFTMRR